MEVFEDNSSAILHLTFDQDEIYNVISFEDGKVNKVDIDPEGDYYANTLDHLLNFGSVFFSRGKKAFPGLHFQINLFGDINR